MKKLQVLFDGLDFAKFSDRAIGNRFIKTLERIDDDLVEKEYEPSSEAEEAMIDLEAEIKDAIEKMAEDEVEKEESEDEDPEAAIDDELISELDAEEVEEDDETSTLDDEDEVEKE